jgi:hypothetical protein
VRNGEVLVDAGFGKSGSLIVGFIINPTIASGRLRVWRFSFRLCRKRDQPASSTPFAMV